MIALDHVAFRYPNGVEALSDVTMSIAAGERIALVGPSGCGKSTLLRIIAGLRIATSGQVQTAPGASLRFQDAALLPWRSVADNIALPLELAHLANPGRVQQLMSLCGLDGFEHARPHELSGGMAQRVALARALVRDPALLLLDEPFGALDALLREQLIASVDAICARLNTTVVMVTHSISEAVFFADRVYVMTARPGRIAGATPIRLPRPRNWAMQRTPAFGAAIGAVRDLLGA
jgi:NitT/TauT family transport system ATP-binding protein